MTNRGLAIIAVRTLALYAIVQGLSGLPSLIRSLLTAVGVGQAAEHPGMLVDGPFLAYAIAGLALWILGPTLSAKMIPQEDVELKPVHAASLVGFQGVLIGVAGLWLALRGVSNVAASLWFFHAFGLLYSHSTPTDIQLAMESSQSLQTVSGVIYVVAGLLVLLGSRRISLWIHKAGPDSLDEALQ